MLDDFPALKNTADPQPKEFISQCRQKADLSAFIQEHQDREPLPELNANFLDLDKDKTDDLGKEFHNRPKITMPKRTDELLIVFEKEAIDLNEVIMGQWSNQGNSYQPNLYDQKWIARAWALNRKALENTIGYLCALKQIKTLYLPNRDHKVRILPNGWQRLQELKKLEALD